MTGIELLALGTKAAGKAAFSKLLSETFAKVSSKGKTLLTDRKLKTSIAKMYTQLGKVRLVKTLWQIDKAVDIGTFYCESHVTIRKSRKKISSVGDFNGLGNVLIEGIAGQGKSIFLRYLCGVEMVRGEYVPIFIELRRITNPADLLGFIISTLAELGVEINRGQFIELAASGRILLLLDGFDEVQEEDKSRMIQEIEHLVNTIEGLRVIISSRAHSGLDMSALFEVVKLSDLEGDEYKTVIHKLLEDSKTATDLLKQVQAHQGEVRELLRTPLLVTLLVINYKSHQEIPAQLAGFFDSLFKLLLQRHDGTKPGYRRQRLCALNDTEYRQVFEAFCYLSKRHQKSILNHARVYETTSEALKSIDSKTDAEKYIVDVVRITCLLAKDGEEYRFIHKSVQEYYAACYIKTRPDIVAQKIYGKLFEGFRNTHAWSQELSFLSEIDSYRFLKMGLLPAICEYLGVGVEKLHTATVEQIHPAVMKRCRTVTMYFSLAKATGKLRSNGFIGDIIPTLRANCLNPFFEIDYSSARPSFSVIKQKDYPHDACLLLGDALDKGFLTQEVRQASLLVARQLLEIGQSSLKRVAMDEQETIAFIPLI